MMRSKAFKKKLAKAVRSGEWGALHYSLDAIKLLPVIQREELARAVLVREIRDLENEAHTFWERIRRAANGVEDLTVAEAEMPDFGTSLQKWNAPASAATDRGARPKPYTRERSRA